MSKPNKIRARRMWKNEGFSVNVIRTAYYNKPVAVLDVSDVDALVEHVAKVIYEYSNASDWGRYGGDRAWYKNQARAILESLGIITKRRAKSNG